VRKLSSLDYKIQNLKFRINFERFSQFRFHVKSLCEKPQRSAIEIMEKLIANDILATLLSQSETF